MYLDTVCRLCSASCPVEVEKVQGKIISVKRKQRYPEDIHQYCPKAQAATEIIYSHRRIKQPKIKKKGGSWQAATWEQALELLANQLKVIKANTGAESICWLRGQASDWGGPWQYVMRLMHAFGSPNAIGNGSVCHAGREALQTWTYGNMTKPDYKNTRCIVCWGRNDQDTNPSAYEDLLFARKKGARLLVIDPVRTDLASKADLWLPVRPGFDGLLAMAMIHYIIEQRLYPEAFVRQWTQGFDKLKKSVKDYSINRVAPIVRLSPEKIISAVQLYMKHQPACLAEGNGLDMHCHMAQNTRALAVLRAISGNLDRKGGYLIPQPVQIKNYQLRKSFQERPIPLSAHYPLFSQYSNLRGIHAMGMLTDAILNEKPYPVKALIIQGANPMVTMANSERFRKALGKLDLLVVIDPVMTRTGRLADMVLPACYSFEQSLLSNKAMSDNCVILHKKVIDPYQNSLPDWEIVFRLARKLGLQKAFPWSDVEEAIEDQLAPSGITLKKLKEHPQGLLYEKTRYQKYLQEGFETPSGKVEIESSLLKNQNYPAIPEFWNEMAYQYPAFYAKKDQYPLVVLSGRRTNTFVHSQFRHIDHLRKETGAPVVEIHPEDARDRDIRDGDWVLITSPNGQIKMQARVKAAAAVGLVRVAWGWGEWQEKYNFNCLTDDQLKDPVTSTTSNRLIMGQIQKID